MWFIFDGGRNFSADDYGTLTPGPWNNKISPLCVYAVLFAATIFQDLEILISNACLRLQRTGHSFVTDRIFRPSKHFTGATAPDALNDIADIIVSIV
jgi:hypothetical protein